MPKKATITIHGQELTGYRYNGSNTEMSTFQRWIDEGIEPSEGGITTHDINSFNHEGIQMEMGDHLFRDEKGRFYVLKAIRRA